MGKISPLLWLSESLSSINVFTLCSRTSLPVLSNGLVLIQALPTEKDLACTGWPLRAASALPLVNEGENLSGAPDVN